VKAGQTRFGLASVTSSHQGFIYDGARVRGFWSNHDALGHIRLVAV